MVVLGGGGLFLMSAVYLAHKKHPPRRTLQEYFAEGPTVVLGRWLFLRSEVPL